MNENPSTKSLAARLSEIMKLLYNAADYTPTKAALHLAIVSAMLGWNRQLGHSEETDYYQEKLETFWPQHIIYFRDFKRGSLDALVDLAHLLKEELYPNDARLIHHAGFTDGKLNVEYQEKSSQ